MKLLLLLYLVLILYLEATPGHKTLVRIGLDDLSHIAYVFLSHNIKASKEENKQTNQPSWLSEISTSTHVSHIEWKCSWNTMERKEFQLSGIQCCHSNDKWRLVIACNGLFTWKNLWLKRLCCSPYMLQVV